AGRRSAYAATLAATGRTLLKILDRDMRKHLLGLMLLAGLTACTPDGQTGRLEATAAGSEGGSRVPATSISQSSLAEDRGSAKSFASLPDRGELLSYGGGRKIRESGAYSYHPVMISETHALNSVGGGDLVLQM